MEFMILSEPIRQFLLQCGESSEKISTCNMETRLYHDLGIYGEIAEDCLEVLHTEFHVDLSNFDFELHFPSEWAQPNSRLEKILFRIFPGIDRLLRERKNYAPITLAMIDRAIRDRKW